MILGPSCHAATSSTHVIDIESTLKHPFVSVKINGSKARKFILDTGASHSMVSYDVAQELGLIKTDIIVEGHAFFEAPLSMSEAVNLKLGESVSRKLQILFPSEKSNLKEQGFFTYYDGVVGLDFFRGCTLKLEGLKSKLSLRNCPAHQTIETIDSIDTRRAVIKLKHGSHVFSTLLDTGYVANGHLVIIEKKENPLLADNPPQVYEIYQTSRAPEPALRFVLDNVTFPNGTTHKLKSVIFPIDSGFKISDGIDAYLDWRLLQNTTIIIDIEPSGHTNVRLETPETMPLEYDGSGIIHLGVNKQGEYSIVKVAKNGPAIRAGLQKDDKIINYNGVELGELTFEMRKAVVHSKAGTPFPITVERNGKEIKSVIMLEDYMTPHNFKN